MPQLNPAPWFLILCLSWMTLILLFYPKTTSTCPLHSPLVYSQASHKTRSWNWPWA